MTEVEEDQDNYETSVWDVFRSMAQGWRVYLIQPVNGPTLWVIPPDLGRQAHYYADKDSIRSAWKPMSVARLSGYDMLRNPGLAVKPNDGPRLRLISRDGDLRRVAYVRESYYAN